MTNPQADGVAEPAPSGTSVEDPTILRRLPRRPHYTPETHTHPRKPQ